MGGSTSITETCLLPFSVIRKKVTEKPPSVTGHRQFLSPRNTYWIKSKKQKARAVKKASSTDSILLQVGHLLPGCCLTVQHISLPLPEPASGHVSPSTRGGGGKTPIPALQAQSRSKSTEGVTCVWCQGDISCMLYAEADLTPMCLCDSLGCRSGLCCCRVACQSRVALMVMASWLQLGSGGSGLSTVCTHNGSIKGASEKKAYILSWVLPAQK